MSDEGNPCAEVVSDGIWYEDPSRPDHLLEALPPRVDCYYCGRPLSEPSPTCGKPHLHAGT